VVLFVNGGSARQGLFRLLADAFSVELGWNIGEDEARQWVRDLSHRGPFRVILAIDDADPDLMGAEIDGFASDAFGGRVQLVISCSTGTLEKFTKSRHGRQFTPFGREAAELELGLLDDDEFRLAVKVLDGFRITFMSGSARSPEYRNPWILRAIAADVKGHPNHTDETLAAGIPSFPGLKLMEFARSRFQDQGPLWGNYVAFAQALLEDVAKPDTALTTGLLSAFICRRETLPRHLSEPEFQDAVNRGELKGELLPDDVRVVVAQIPELAALALARQLRNRLLKTVDTDPIASARSLVNACNRMPLGDVIGAYALAEAATERGGLPIATLMALLQQPPRKEGFAPGARLRAVMGDRCVDIDVGAKGELFLITPKGERHRLETEGDQGMIADMTAWMILSYFAAMPIQVIDGEAAEVLGWIDTHILETVATCPFVLRNPVPGMTQEVRTHPTPTGSVVCHREGVVEPITLALFLAAAHDRRRGDYLTAAATASKSAPFLMRMYIALRMVAELVDEGRRQWAISAADTILPQIKERHLFH
jgi:hypothetical protein